MKDDFPGNWDSVHVMGVVGANMRYKRTRVRKRFKEVKQQRQMTRPPGCSVESWDLIQKSLTDKKKHAKYLKCKAAAEERMKKVGFAHRLGRAGIDGVVERFVSI